MRQQEQEPAQVRGTYLDTADLPFTQTEQQYSAVASEFAHLADFPPGTPPDPYMGACYAAVTDLLTQDHPVSELVTDVLSKREISTKHFVNLFYRGVQYVELFERNNKDYPAAYNTKDVWKEELTDIVANDGATLKDVLLQKSTTTTIYQRYAGSHAVLSALFPGRSLAVADFGCGGNYGLRGMDIQEPFKPFLDHTDGKLVQQLTRQPVQVGNGVAIDWQDPYAQDVTDWRLACSFYPQELHTFADVVALEVRLTEAQHVRFLQGDLLALPVGTPSLPVHEFDAVVMNTVCYQMPEAQERLIETAAKLLKPKGLFIVQDFAEKDPNNPHRLNFGVPWHEQQFFYRTFVIGEQTNWEMKELLQWNDGRCKAVKPGEDYHLLQPVLFTPAA